MLSLLQLKTKYQSLSDNQPINLTYKLSIQIAILQIFYYITAFIMISSTCLLLGWGFHFSWIWKWDIITIENSLGLTLSILWLINALLSTFFIAFIIGRSKVVWDFATTIHFIHLVIVWICSGFPKSIYWWSLQLVSVLLMIILGTYMSRWIELRDTFFNDLNDIELANNVNK